MTKLLLLASVAFLAAAPAKAATFTVSNAFGTGTFGTATAVDLGATTGSTDTVKVTIDMSPNFVLDTGSHFALTLSLTGTGRIDGSTLNTLNPGEPTGTFTAQTHDTTAPYSNSPFGNFTDAIAGACGSGSSSGGCGSTLVFDILNFAGFTAATSQFGTPPQNIFAAVDIFQSGCTGDGCTGAVGLTAAPIVHSVQLDADPRSCLAVCQRCCWSRRTCSSQAETKTVRSLAPSIRHRRWGAALH